MKKRYLAVLTILAGNIVSFVPAAHADMFRLPEEISRVEAPRDMNLFQIEPTIIHERYFTSGRGERHQYVGNVLPAGAPIPDNDAPEPKRLVPIRSTTPSPITPNIAPGAIVPTSH